MRSRTAFCLSACETLGRISNRRHRRRLFAMTQHLCEPRRSTLKAALQDDLSQRCATADGIAKARLIEFGQRIASRTALKAELEVMVEGCRHGRLAECRVIQVLADHGPHH